MRLLLLLCLCALRVAAEPGAVLRIQPAAEIPLKAEAAGVLLPAVLCGESRPLLLDSGSQGHFVSQALAPQLGSALPDTEGQTAAGPHRFARHRAPEHFRIAGLPPGAAELALFDTAALSAAFGRPVAGTAGLAVMRRHCWIFDFDAGMLTIGPRLDAPAGDVSPAPADSLVHLPVEFPAGVTVPFLLDTGAAGWGTLEAELFDALAARSLIRVLPEKVRLQTSGGLSEEAPQATLRGLKLNGHSLPEMTLVRSNLSRLGWRTFTAFNWQIDLSRSEIFILPRQPAPRSVSTPTPKKTP